MQYSKVKPKQSSQMTSSNNPIAYVVKYCFILEVSSRDGSCLVILYITSTDRFADWPNKLLWSQGTCNVEANRRVCERQLSLVVVTTLVSCWSEVPKTQGKLVRYLIPAVPLIVSDPFRSGHLRRWHNGSDQFSTIVLLHSFKVLCFSFRNRQHFEG